MRARPSLLVVLISKEEVKWSADAEGGDSDELESHKRPTTLLQRKNRKAPGVGALTHRKTHANMR